MLWKGAFLKTVKISPQTSATVCHFYKDAGRKPVTLQKLHSNMDILLGISGNFQNSFSVEHLWTTASIGLSNAQCRKKKRSAHTSLSLLKQTRKWDFVGTVHVFVQTKYRTIRANALSPTSLVSKTKREYTDYRTLSSSLWILLCIKKENNKPYSDQLQIACTKKIFLLQGKELFCSTQKYQWRWQANIFLKLST